MKQADSTSFGSLTNAEDRARARGAVLLAARTCFLENGVRGTTMEDVARASGSTRQVVYKLFLGRRELVEAAVVERISELADDVARRRTPPEGLADSFVTASLAVIEGIRNDPELRVLLGTGSPVSLHDALWLPTVRERGIRFWSPWLAEAGRKGVLRKGVSESELSDWLQTVYASIILRKRIDEDAERALVRRFVLPSILAITPE